jgi:hypothetical protein
LEGQILPKESQEGAWDFSNDEFRAGRMELILAQLRALGAIAPQMRATRI